MRTSQSLGLPRTRARPPWRQKFMRIVISLLHLAVLTTVSRPIHYPPRTALALFVYPPRRSYAPPAGTLDCRPSIVFNRRGGEPFYFRLHVGSVLLSYLSLCRRRGLGTSLLTTDTGLLEQSLGALYSVTGLAMMYIMGGCSSIMGVDRLWASAPFFCIFSPTLCTFLHHKNLFKIVQMCPG